MTSQTLCQSKKNIALKKLLLDIAKVMVKKSDNTIDDKLVNALEKALFPGR